MPDFPSYFSSLGVPVTRTNIGGGFFGSSDPISYSRISTLTPQQQELANLLQGNIQTGTGVNNLYPQQGAQMANALSNALTSNPAASISPQATANYVNMAVATPLLRQYDQTIMPRLKDAYAAVGALMGSRRGLAQQRALEELQTTIGTELGRAQLANQQLSAQLSEQMAERQAQTVNAQQQNMLGYNALAAQLTGQSHMAIQPYLNANRGSSITTNQIDMRPRRTQSLQTPVSSFADYTPSRPALRTTRATQETSFPDHRNY